MLTCDLNAAGPRCCGLHSRNLRLKWSRTRSLSWVSPVRQNWARNSRRDESRVRPEKANSCVGAQVNIFQFFVFIFKICQTLQYSSATARLKSLFLQRWRDTSDLRKPSRL